LARTRECAAREWVASREGAKALSGGLVRLRQVVVGHIIGHEIVLAGVL
jgi:hypothetical protein